MARVLPSVPGAIIPYPILFLMLYFWYLPHGNITALFLTLMRLFLVSPHGNIPALFLTLMQIFLASYLVRWTPHFCGACWCQCSRSPQCYWRRPNVLLTNSLCNARSFTKIILRKWKNTFCFNCSRNNWEKTILQIRKEYLEEWLPASGWACTALGSTPGA